MNASLRNNPSGSFARALALCLLALCSNFALAATAIAPLQAAPVHSSPAPRMPDAQARPGTAAVPAATVALSETQKIQMLIHDVETTKDIRFVRNGSDHDGPAAADHLRMKLRYAGNRIKTAQDFITYLASASSWSGKPYRIRFADGREMDAGPFFRARLAIIEHAAGAGQPIPASTH